MSGRRYERLACGLAVCLIAVQILIKPQPDTGEVRAAAERARRTRPWEARTAPGFVLGLQSGGAFRLSDETGRHVVILNFFTTSSEPCRRELPALDRYVQGQQRQGRRLLAIAINNQESAAVVGAYSSALNITLPIAIDASGSVSQQYGVTQFPTTVVMGAEGRVALYHPEEIRDPAAVFDALLDAEFATLTRLDRMKAR